MVKYTAQLPNIKGRHIEYVQTELIIFERQTSHAELGQTCLIWEEVVTLIEFPSYVRKKLNLLLMNVIFFTVPLYICKIPVPDESKKWINPPEWTQYKMR